MNRPGQAPPVAPPAVLPASPPVAAPRVARAPRARWRPGGAGFWRGAGGDALRVLRGVALAGLGALVLLLAAAGGLAWRLSQGPVGLDWLAPRVEAAARAEGVPLSLSGLALGWSGFRDPGAPLRVSLRDLRVGPPGYPVASAARFDVSLALLPLASGRLVPGQVRLDAARIELVLAPDGLHLADGTGLASPGPPPGAPAWLADVRELLATDTRATILDRRLGVTWAVSAPRATLRRAAAGLVGDTAAMLSAQPAPDAAFPDALRPPGPEADAPLPPDAPPAARVAVQVSLRPAPDQRGWSVVRARLDPVDPAALGRTLPRLPGGVAVALAALDLPLTLSAEATLDPALSPRRFAARLDGAAGHVVVGSASLGVSAVALRGEGTPGHATLTLERLAMTAPQGARAPPPTFTGTASLGRDATGLLAQVGLSVDHAAFAELADYWPRGIARNAQAWVTGNITAGTAYDGRVDLTLRAAPDGSGLRLVAAGGQLLGEDATLHWLRPVPPLEHMQARLVLEGPDSLSVATQGGTERGGPERSGPAREGGEGAGVRLGAGLVRITGLSARDQVATIGVDLHGGLAALVRLLSHPRLRLLSEHPLGFTAPRGRFETHLDLTVPLETNLDVDQIGLRARTRATQVHLGEVVAGQDLDAGMIDLDVTAQGLSARGTALVAHMPARLTLDMDFRTGGPAKVVQRATVRADADAVRLGKAGLDKAGLDLAGVVEGPVGLDAHYEERRDGHATVAIAADLSAAALDLPLGWSKPAGAASDAHAVLLLDHGHLRGIERLHAAAPGLLLQGHAELGTRGGVLHVEHAAIGRTEASGTVRFPQNPGAAVRADIAGPLLDLSALIDTAAAAADAPARPAGPASEAPPGRAGTPWVLDARFARVLLGRGHSIAPVSAHVEDDGRRLDSARLCAGEGAGSLRASVSAQPAPAPAPASASAGVRHVEIRAADAGALLSSLDLTDQVRGGRLALGGTFEEGRPGPSVDATLRVDGFNLLGAPAAGRLMQAATLFGLVDLLHGPGLHVGRLDLPFRMADRVIDIHDARATSASLGVTAAGRIDLDTRRVDVAGTIVPAYLPNQLPGRLPLVGSLFSPERGGGVFAATYTVRGPLDAPRVSVNPLALLAPGFLRRLLGLP